jgi:hypothetical protein
LPSKSAYQFITSQLEEEEIADAYVMSVGVSPVMQRSESLLLEIHSSISLNLKDGL